ncbi:MAG: efflux RND transporter periplasmic adaptor subunit [Alphaproteobacteria bacterium]|nr:efflux RND transporter periplasmic adaptor subunit [Alphaproteobacteria bacterium]
MSKSWIIALAVLLIATGWVLSGHIGAETRPEPSAAKAQTAAKPAAAPTQVRVRISDAEAITREITVRGRSAYSRAVEVKAETVGRVVALNVAKGSRVKTGQVIARLAEDDRQAKLAEANAMVATKRLEFEQNKQLFERGFRPETKVMQSKAELEAAQAAVARITLDLEKTVIRAPFEGVIEALPAEIGHFVGVGGPIATVIDLDPFLVIGQVSEREIGALKVGAPGAAKLASGDAVEGRIRFLGTAANPETRTFRVELEVPNRDGRLRDGVTADLRLPVERTKAHLVSPAVLALNEAGAIGVRLVDGGGRVSFHPVRIVADRPDGVYLAGLPERITLIVVGQEFVKDGEQVAVVVENAVSS